ncbi:MAG: electron transfer flavoprotein subunit alpha/FixB family protein [Deltaproteobacteria bacterium]|nr:electron transfer flavoprotein subunit alpha/FixB family protein [Deltaproteobacteria bacterium]
MGDILLIAEHEKGRCKRTALELAGKAAALAPQMGAKVHALCIGAGGADAAAELGAAGVTHVTVLEIAGLGDRFDGDAYTAAIAEFLRAHPPAAVLAAASPMGKECLPRVAMRLGAGLIPDAVDVRYIDGRLVATHPVFAGKALADCVARAAPAIILVRPNVFAPPAPKAGAAPAVAAQTVAAGVSRARVTDVTLAERTEEDLTEAGIVVSGGRAMASAENFKYIRELAQAIGGTVGASRAAVDAGYISHDHQVGQTGKTVNPTLYIACGISGAIQHLAGMRTSKWIVAINKDPDAPIFTKADFGIVGDLFRIVPLLAERIRQTKREV